MGSPRSPRAPALYVTLLKASNGVAAGAEIILNPTYTLITPASATEGGYQLGGGGLGAYAFAHVGDEIEAETGKLGGKNSPRWDHDEQPLSRSRAESQWPGGCGPSTHRAT